MYCKPSFFPKSMFVVHVRSSPQGLPLLGDIDRMRLAFTPPHPSNARYLVRSYTTRAGMSGGC
jgi:hypothetical protein